jgi:hypoxanthine phosphoribosyltransferase
MTAPTPAPASPPPSPSVAAGLVEFGSGRPLADLEAEFFAGRSDDAGFGDRHSWMIVITAAEVDLLVRRVASEINERYRAAASDERPLAILGLLNGVFVFAAQLSSYLDIPHTMDFIKASSYTGVNEQTASVRITPAPDASALRGRPVLILDELFDTGKTLDAVRAAYVRDCGVPGDHIATCTLFAKEQPGHVDAGADLYRRPDIVGIGFMPSFWLVGCGLDEGGKYRGWRHVCGKIRSGQTGAQLFAELPESVRAAALVDPAAVTPHQVYWTWRAALARFLADEARLRKAPARYGGVL